MSITTRLEPENPDVQGVLRGEDCAVTIMNLGWGTADVAVARRQGEPVHEPVNEPVVHPDLRRNQLSVIGHVRRIEMTDELYWFVYWRCVVVVGEP